MSLMHRARAVFPFVCMLVVLSAASSSLAGQVPLAPAYDAEASSTNGTNFVLSDGAWNIFTQHLPQYNIDKRAVMEFSLSSVQGGQQITSASLRLGINVLTDSPLLTVYGFGGDGISQVADATKTTTILAQNVLITSLGTINVNLDTAYLNTLRSSYTHVGLVMFDPYGDQVGFYSKEGSAISSVTPQLTLTYTPEPISLTMLSVGMGWLVSRRRR